MTENQSISQQETPETLADRLSALSNRVREVEGIRLWKFIYQIEADEVGLLEGLAMLEKFLLPKTASEEKARQMVLEADKISKEPYDWPPIGEDEFTITVDIECDGEEDDRPYMVLFTGGQEIYRRPTWYGSTLHLQRVTEDMRSVYQGRVKDVVLNPGVEDLMVMDSYQGGAVRRVLRPIRKDFMKRHNSQ